MANKRKPGRRKHFLWLLYYKLFRSSERFTLGGEEYPYFYHWYNRTWRNERTVEIPIVRRILEARPEASVLEVGNVLSHYFGKDHEVVDKYEKAHGVQNIDVSISSPTGSMTSSCASRPWNMSAGMILHGIQRNRFGPWSISDLSWRQVERSW